MEPSSMKDYVTSKERLYFKRHLKLFIEDLVLISMFIIILIVGGFYV
jgi:hypothetical protein